MVPGPRPLLGRYPLAAPLLAPKKGRSNPQGNWSNAKATIIVSELVPIFAPVLGQMPVVHEPSLQLLQFATHLPPLLCKAPRFSLVNLPCLVLASVSRARPSLVLGPVLAPPCSLQRPTGSLAGRWHRVPRRVLASHRIPCQFGP